MYFIVWTDNIFKISPNDCLIKKDFDISAQMAFISSLLGILHLTNQENQYISPANEIIHCCAKLAYTTI